MAIDFNTSRMPTGELGWQQFFAAVEASAESDETMWLEHKTNLDPSTNSGSATLAKTIVAFANRDSSRSATWFGGHALVLVGLGPGNIPGTPEIDPAVLHDKVDRYLAKPTPDWDTDQRTYKDQNILVITVSPPRDGDPIFMIGTNGGDPKGDGQVKDGQIYVRRPGKSDVARSDDIRRLEARLVATTASTPTLDIRVEPASDDFSIPWLDYDPDWVDRWVASERERLLAPLKPKKPDPKVVMGMASSALSAHLSSVANVVQQSLSRYDSLLGTRREETRSKDDYIVEVEEYLAKAAQRLPAVTEDLPQHHARPLSLVVHNNTQCNYADLKVEIHVEGAVLGFERAGATLPSIESVTGKPPRIWGPYTEPSPFNSVGMRVPNIARAPSSANLRPASVSRLRIINGGSVTIRFPVFNLRPGESHELNSIALVAEEHFADTTRCTWKATATNVNAIAEGVFTLSLERQPVDVEQDLRDAAESRKFVVRGGGGNV